MSSRNFYYGIDRRKYPRVNASVTYSVVESSLTQNMQAAKNISEGGIAFFARDAISVGAELELDIALPDMSDIKARVKVIWREPVKIPDDDSICCELGVEFFDLDEQIRKKISRYVFLRLDTN